MSTYYDYRDVKVMIAHKLMSLEGWKVYGYKEDESDSMTDYYSPAYWGGIAEKNGYILCVDVYRAAEEQEIKQYTNAGAVDNSIHEKISKLEELNTKRGATVAEEATAQKRIEVLKNKLKEQQAEAGQYIVVGKIPGHMANPPRMNWHIEKDGIIIAKGNGILKYAEIDNYYSYPRYMEDMKKFKTISREEYIKDYVFNSMNKWNDSEECATESANSHYESMVKDAALMEKFEQFISKIDTTCGGLIGEGDGAVYGKITVTEYKTELKPVETASGEIKEGQLFILKTTFNYGRSKGLVYRIHKTEYDGKISYHAYKLNGKLTKECTGMASSNNYWFIGAANDERFLKWIEKGAIAWGELQEVKTPYEVEKVVKKTIKAEKKTAEKNPETGATTENADVSNYTFEVSEDTDTRTNEKIYLVKVAEKLSREKYIKVNQYIKSLGGYYSKFKHAFLFKESPTEKLYAEKAVKAQRKQ